jgi:RES domain-containing protein
VRLWRISNHADLQGIGGLRAAARWHSRGRPIVYLAESPPGALIEILVHQEMPSPSALPDTYRLLMIEVDETVMPLECPPLPPDWSSRQDVTRAVGDDWLAQGASALLRVPGAIMPDVYNNVLLNPIHPDIAKIRIVEVRDVSFDPRLFKSIPSDKGVAAVERST